MILRDVKYTNYRGRKEDIDHISKALGLPEGDALKLNESDYPRVIGDRGLLLAIIGQAYLDALRGDDEALEYFDSDLYRHHLETLGLNTSWLPEGLTRYKLASEERIHV